ncbi:MAG: Fe-S cluster assembly protein SufD [Bryobacteraceae bacterium]
MTSTAEQNRYLAAWEELSADVPAWLAALRHRAMRRFSDLGFPTTHDEEWRFTNVAPVARTQWQPSARTVAEKLFAVPGAAALGFVNGRLASADPAPEGTRLSSLADAMRAEPELLERHLGAYADFEHHAFAALNTAFASEGAFVLVGRNRVVQTPIHIVWAAAGPGITQPRTLVLAGANSQVTVIETYIGADGEYFTNAVTEICAGENALVEHYKLQLEGPRAFHVGVTQAQVGRAANYSAHSIALGGALARNDSNAVLGEGSQATLNGLYLAGGTQHIDNHTAIDHASPHAASRQLYKGILDGRATAVFNGKIYVRPDAQKTDAKQTNKNLVLSEDAVIHTKPELQIWADDVRCTHGATIGQLDAESVFYLRSRGIGAGQARQILTEAFARDILDYVRVESLRELLEKVLTEKLHEHRE